MQHRFTLHIVSYSTKLNLYSFYFQYLEGEEKLIFSGYAHIFLLKLLGILQYNYLSLKLVWNKNLTRVFRCYGNIMNHLNSFEIFVLCIYIYSNTYTFQHLNTHLGCTNMAVAPQCKEFVDTCTGATQSCPQDLYFDAGAQVCLKPFENQDRSCQIQRKSCNYARKQNR